MGNLPLLPGRHNHFWTDAARVVGPDEDYPGQVMRSWTEGETI